jgi:hypothetical protein
MIHKKIEDDANFDSHRKSCWPRKLTPPIANRSSQLESHTHASFANHSCVVRQSGQYVQRKNTGLLRNVSRSIWMPVDISRFVFGQRTITMAIGLSYCCLLSNGLQTACEKEMKAP